MMESYQGAVGRGSERDRLRACEFLIFDPRYSRGIADFRGVFRKNSQTLRRRKIQISRLHRRDDSILLKWHSRTCRLADKEM